MKLRAETELVFREISFAMVKLIALTALMKSTAIFQVKKSKKFLNQSILMFNKVCFYLLDCLPNEKACKNKKCAPRSAFCDGEDDCGDNSDEESCGEFYFI